MRVLIVVVDVAVFLLRSLIFYILFFFFSSRRRHTRSKRDWSSDVCSSDLRIRSEKRHPIAWFHVDQRKHHRSQDHRDRKSTRLNSSHVSISYAVFCLKKKITTREPAFTIPHMSPERTSPLPAGT